MPKTPSMLPADCEAQLGPRGHLTVTNANRPMVRKWCVAMGLPGDFVAGLTYTELALAYNRIDGSGLASVRQKLESFRRENPTSLEDSDDPTPVAPVTNSDGDSADIVAAIRAIAETVTPKTPSIDADAVRAILHAEFPKLIPVTRLEIVTNGVTRDLGTAPRHPKFVRLVSALSQGLNVMLVGPAGSGKTVACEQAATALERMFRIEGAVSGEHKLMGYCDGYGKYHATPFRDAFEHGHLFVKDEIDADDPAALLALNSAIDNGFAAFPDCVAPVMRGTGFQCVACANTFGAGADRQYVGRNQLDAATLNRFVVIEWGYDEKLESAIVSNAQWVARVQAIRAAVVAEKARIVVSMRASIFGAKLLAAGWPQNEVEESVIWKGTDSELQRRILARVC